MGPLLTVVDETEEAQPTRQDKIWRERLTEDVLFKGTDDCGRSGWFLRLTVSGLYPRRVGPYRTKGQALTVLEAFIATVQTDLLCDIENDMTDTQAYVVEGVPSLVESR